VIKINYLDERELLVKRGIETRSPNSKSPKCYRCVYSQIRHWWCLHDTTYLFWIDP